MSHPFRDPCETELKLRLASQGALRLAEAEVEGGEARTLRSIYFDTRDHKLRRLGYALRVRQDGERFVQTVKGPLESGQRRYERETSTTGPEVDLEALKETPLKGVLQRGETLSALFETRVSRRTKERRAGGSLIEVSLDEGEVVSADRRASLSELELELKSGSAEALFLDARRLAEAEALVLDFTSKAERGYRLASGALREPVKFKPQAFSAAQTAGEALQVAFRDGLARLADNAALFQEAARPEAVHQARVALRRLRVALSVFKPLIPATDREALKAELVWATGAFALARDLDVFAVDLVHPALRAGPHTRDFAAFGEALRQARTLAYARCREALSSPRFRTLLIDAARFTEVGDWIEAPLTKARAALPLRGFAEGALDARLRGLRRRKKRMDWDDPSQIHKLRIAAKKMRYASDLFAGLARSWEARDRFVAELKELQDQLGAINDLRMAAVSAKAVLESTSAPSHEVGFAAGYLVADADRRRKASSAKLKKQARAFLETPPWW